MDNNLAKQKSIIEGYILNKDFDAIVETILDGSNTWIKTRRAFILSEVDLA